MGKSANVRFAAFDADYPFAWRLKDGNLGHLGAPPWCYTVIFRRFEKSLFLKDFFAVEKGWRRGRDLNPVSLRAMPEYCIKLDQRTQTPSRLSRQDLFQLFLSPQDIGFAGKHRGPRHRSRLRITFQDPADEVGRQPGEMDQVADIVVSDAFTNCNFGHRARFAGRELFEPD